MLTEPVIELAVYIYGQEIGHAPELRHLVLLDRVDLRGFFAEIVESLDSKRAAGG